MKLIDLTEQKNDDGSSGAFVMYTYKVAMYRDDNGLFPEHTADFKADSEDKEDAPKAANKSAAVLAYFKGMKNVEGKVLQQNKDSVVIIAFGDFEADGNDVVHGTAYILSTAILPNDQVTKIEKVLKPAAFKGMDDFIEQHFDGDDDNDSNHPSLTAAERNR